MFVCYFWQPYCLQGMHGKTGWNTQAWLLSKRDRCTATWKSWLSTRKGWMSKVFWQMRSWLCFNLIHPLKSLGCRGWRQVGAHDYMGKQFDNPESTAVFEVYMKRISSNHVACPSLSHTISVCQCQYMLSTYVSISASCWKYVWVQVTLHSWTL